MNPTTQTILVVEDDKVLRDILVDQLKRHGYAAEEAEDGEVALQKMTAQKPDLILLDILMPKKGGMEVMEEMNKDPNLVHIPVVIISNSGQPVEIERAKQLGAKDFLIKEIFEPSEVIEKVRSILSEGASRTTLEPAQSKDEQVDFEISDESTASEASDKTEQKNTPGGGEKILVVEDDKFLRELFIKKLYSDGFDVKNAIDAKAAFEILGEWRPNIILLDLILPGEDGFSVLGRLKKDEKLASIPVMVLSNLGQKEDIDKAIGLGAIDFMVKANYTLEEIIDRVKQKMAG